MTGFFYAYFNVFRMFSKFKGSKGLLRQIVTF